MLKYNTIIAILNHCQKTLEPQFNVCCQNVSIRCGYFCIAVEWQITLTYKTKAKNDILMAKYR